MSSPTPFTTPSPTPSPVPNLISTSNANTLMLLILALLLIIPSIATSIGFMIGGIYFLTKLHYYRRSKAHKRQTRVDTLREEIELDVLNLVDGKAVTWDGETNSIKLQKPENAMMAPDRGEGRSRVNELQGSGVVDKEKDKVPVKEKWDGKGKGEAPVRDRVVDKDGFDEPLVSEHVFDNLRQSKKLSERLWPRELERWTSYLVEWQSDEPESSSAQELLWDAAMNAVDQEEEFGQRVVERSLV
ncbi:hypothetical protein BCR34DRAFT_225850 [Clohesyomyces aquaticus]|uniref:Uncharacterized protein n=1 Tax=Clohesyomyces aquaticus TaxID=1231657 RepID=A0A1Y1Y8F1_9PLEO|nr:hypothetical protein BCR34DRAFT_225850 [Clohesyomyces aquaticus]